MKLGSFRFFLAFLVSISHLWAGMIHGPAAYAVWGFYLISGYLMGYVLNESYGFSKNGIRKFYLNRAIRIYPGYILSLIIGIFVYKLCINNLVALNSLNPEFGKPSGIQGILFNLTLIPIFQTSSLIVPVSQALGLEVGFYLLAPLIAANRYCAYLAIIITAGINWKLNIELDSFGARYSGYWSALFAFSIGIAIYFNRDFFAKYANLKVAMLFWIIHCFIWIYIPSYPWRYGLYISLIFTGFVLISNCNIKSGSFDVILGDMSYIVYLLHTTVGYFILSILRFDQQRSFEFFIITYVTTCILSFVIVLIIERPLQTRLKNYMKRI